MQVLIVDDHELVREGLKLLLGRLGTNVSVLGVSSVAEGLEQTAIERFDLIVLDLKLPGMDGIAGVQALRARFPETPTILISGNYRKPDIFAAYQSGAVGFISKNMGNEAMLNAVRLVMAGEKYVPSEVISVQGRDLAHSAGSRPNGVALQHLTRREQDVLAKLFEGLQNKEIAWELKIEEITVKLHLTRVYKKLGVRNRIQAVTRALDLGWTPRLGANGMDEVPAIV